jgi:hypothetical protein
VGIVTSFVRLSHEELAVEGMCGWFLQVIDLFDCMRKRELNCITGVLISP